MALNCTCAGCNMARMREKKLHEDAMKQLKASIDRGDLDHLKPTTDSKGHKP